MPVTRVEVAGSVSSRFFNFVVKVSDEVTGKISTSVNGCNILGGCLFESVLTTWRSSLLEDARAILTA